MIEQLFKAIRIEDQQLSQNSNGGSFKSQKVTRYENTQNDNYPQIEVHAVGMINQNNQHEEQNQQQQHIDDMVLQDLKAVMNTAIFKSKKRYSKEYIPLASIVDNAYLKQHQIKNLHFQHISLNSVNHSSLHKVVFKHNEDNKEIRFYIPTFLRFSLIKLHSQDLKNITHIENKNNMIIYINVFTRGLPKMLIDKLTRKTKGKQTEEEAKLLFRANRHLFEAKYYTSYGDYLIFMFNPFSENMIEFEIMKNVMFAPFQQAELILHIRINKKIFKLQRPKTLRIARSGHQTPQQQQSPIKRKSRRLNSSISIDDSIQEEQHEEDEEIQRQQFDILQFSKIVLEFKLEKPKNVADSFRFHKSIEFGNYGIMTNEINIHIGTYESPQKKKELQEEKQELVADEEDLHQAQMEDISSLRLSIGLYKHPVTDVCTFFIPLTLAGGLTLLLFHLCDHSLVNELEVLAVILVAYGAFIPQFRDRISMSRTVIWVDLYIVYNMIPAVLCALQSITESRHMKTYNSYEIISSLIYYVSVLFLVEVYLLFVFIEEFYFKIHKKEMVHNFDTQIFETQDFMEEQERFLSWFVLKNQKERAFFCEIQDPIDRKQKPKFTRKETMHFSKVQDRIDERSDKKQNQQELAESLALQIRMSATTNKSLHQVKQSEQQESHKREQNEYLYRTKVIENERHIHSFQKKLSWKSTLLGFLLMIVVLAFTIWLSWQRIVDKMSFEDLNRNCIHDEDEEERLSRIESLISRQQKLGDLIQQNWDDASIPVALHRSQKAHKATISRKRSQNRLSNLDKEKNKETKKVESKGQIFESRHHLRQKGLARQ